MNKLDVLIQLDKMNWHFAKTMKNIPHEYARRSEFHDKDKYREIAAFIKAHGEPEKFFKRTFNYFHGFEHKYWIMDDDPADVEIINRAKKEAKAKIA
jgi:hypothetical protein